MMKFALPPKLDDPSNQFGPNEYINAQIRETQKEMISKHTKWLDDRIRKAILDRIGEDIPLEEISHRLVEFRKKTRFPTLSLHSEGQKSLRTKALISLRHGTLQNKCRINAE